MVIFIPGYLKVKMGKDIDLNKKLRETRFCKRINPAFFFEESYLERTNTFHLWDEDVEIDYELNGECRKFNVSVSIYLSALDVKDQEEKFNKKNKKEKSFTIPLAFSILVENAPVSVDDLIAIPFFLAWRNGCGCGGENSPNPFIDSMKDRVERLLGAELVISEKGRFFISALEVDWNSVENKFGKNASIHDLVTAHSQELYGLAVTDEGYRAVKPGHAKKKIEEWSHGNRVYFEQIVSPTSMILIKADRNRVEFEKMKLSKCRLWSEYVLAHEKEERMLCHHGAFYQGQYIALTFSTIEMLGELVKETVRKVKEEKESLKGKDIETVLKDIENLKVRLESYLRLLSPKKVSKLGGITLLMERMYEARGLATFSRELEEAIDMLAEIMKEGQEMIEKRLEKEKFHHLEIGITVLEALPISYFGQWALQFFNIRLPTPFVVGVTVLVLLVSWWLYKGRKVSRWEKEQSENFVKMAEKILDSVF